jgi:hypothetical protein
MHPFFHVVTEEMPLWVPWYIQKLPDLGVTLIGVFFGALLAYGIERLIAARRDESRRRTILKALGLEIINLVTAVDSDMEAYQRQGDRYFFQWILLPVNTVQQALHEASLLRLSDLRITELQKLLLIIEKANAYVRTYFAAVWVNGPLPGDTAQKGVYDWVLLYNGAISDRFLKVKETCLKLLGDWLITETVALDVAGQPRGNPSTKAPMAPRGPTDVT